MRWLLFSSFVFLVCASVQTQESFDLDHQIDPFDHHPRLLVKNGHLVLLTGRNKDIIFRSSGNGQIKINGNDLLASKLSQLDRPGQSQPTAVVPSSGQANRQVSLIEQRIQSRMDQLSTLVNATNKLYPKAMKQLRVLTRRLRRIERLLRKNECQSNPCQNGATCEDGFNKYICRCTEGFKGQNCESDVNECSHYQGTELGCQNGGTCLNTLGGYHCLCPANYGGVRCTVQFDDCRNVSNHEICGNGLCLNLARTQSGVARYQCVCYQGFTKSGKLDSSPCDVDIDECATGVHHCSRNPPVACINKPDGYTCGPCPVGYSGDGYRCDSTDACSINNGGCSLTPRVACFDLGNGQVRCGSCPPGYVGDGFTCSAVDGNPCTANNGGCSPLAVCMPNRAIGVNYRSCTCPSQYTGNGLGPNGCIPKVNASCATMQCQNGGTCQEITSYGAVCLCPEPYTGFYCERSAASCQTNPCRNNAVCVDVPGSYSCICTKDYYGRNCEQVRSQCGGEFESEAGVLTYPLAHENGTLARYGNNASCVWIIRSQQGKVLNVTFTRFSLEKSFNCLFDYLEIYDGPSREYPKVGRYCGNDLPKKNGVIITSFNSVYLYFKTDPTFALEGFELNWITVEPSCGGMITNQSHGMIQSPGFPHHYPTKLDCHWQVVADYGKRIQFLFTHLDLEPSPNCSYDYLEFREGLQLRESGSIIARFCNWTSSAEVAVPPPVTTSSRFARLHFHSDEGLSTKGFQVVFNQVAGVCGGLLTGTGGIFQSPSTSFTAESGRTYLVYENNIICDWTIRVLPNERVSLKFLTFAIESDVMHRLMTRQYNRTRCMFDFVEVYDGADFDAPLRARLCGRVKPPEIISSGRYLRVRFQSDASVSLRGFIAQYRALCGSEMDGLEGRFETPNYPNPVVANRNCTYLVNVPSGYIVRLEIEEMDIEFDHRCLFDYVQIEGKRYCGQDPPPAIYSMSNEMRLVYVNDESKPSRGFKAKWTAVELGCGGVLRQGEPAQAISIDRLVERPPIDQCLWEIRANESNLVRIKFYHSEISHAAIANAILSGNLDCTTKNYIMLNDSDGSLIKRFCTDDLPPPITSTGAKLFVTFVFNSSPIGGRNESINSSSTTTSNPQASFSLDLWRNFYANYFFITARRFCDRNLFKNKGVIRSPRYPRRYPPNRNCSWIIQVDNGLQIRLNFTRFHLEPRNEINGRCYDYIEIRNGRRADSPLIGIFCGGDHLPDIVSHSSYLFLRFISDASMSGRGFKMYYEATSTGCGGVLTASSGSIESPGYPDRYFNNLYCEWLIRISAGSTIDLAFASLDIEEAGECTRDYVQLFDGPDANAKSLGQFCNRRVTVLSMSSSSNQVFVRFVTDETVRHGGFKLNYAIQCNRTLSGRFGVIESPDYPQSHPHNLNCNWHILGPLGNNITVAFSALNLEQSVTINDAKYCLFDFVNITEVHRTRALSMARLDRIKSGFNDMKNVTKASFCGNYTGNLPRIKTEANEVIIKFVSDETKSIESSFRLEWAAEGCGGEFRTERGKFSSPFFPNPYPSAVECLWHIHAPAGRRVDLRIHTLEVELSQDCTFDYLQVLGGPDETAPELLRLCRDSSNVQVSSVGDAMTIRFISDESSTRRGFNASFSTTTRGCGGEFIAERGMLTSPNYGRGNTYDPKSDCGYKIQVKGNFDIELTLNDLHLPESVNCSQGYLAIYDSPDESMLLMKLCGGLEKVNQTVIRSSDNALYLRFKADGVHTSRGFNVTYRQVCGKTITVGDAPIEITSTHYPHLVWSDNSCHFIFKTAKPSDTLTLHFLHLHTFNVGLVVEDVCQIINVTVYEGPREDAHKRLVRYCNNVVGPPVVSTGDTLLLVTHLMAFRAQISSLKSFCGGDLTASEGFISNPGYPNSYPQSIECIWLLKAAPGNRYSLRLDDFELEESDYCNNDYLEIRLSNSSGPLFGDSRLCGSNVNQELNLGEPGDVWIKFRSDDSNVAKGFMLHFEIATRVMLSGVSGEIASPGYPGGVDMKNQTYSWSIVVSPHHYIQIRFLEFAFAGDSQYLSSCSGKLAIYNGLINLDQMEAAFTQPISGVPQFGLPEARASYCGQHLPPTFVSTSNAVTMMYHTHYYVMIPNKFRVQWSAINATEMMAMQALGVPADVNSTFNIFVEQGQEFNLIHQNFTEYGNDINWYFETRGTMHFNLTIHSFSFYPSFSCWTNKMVIYLWREENRKWQMFKTLCNGFNGAIEVSDQSQFRLHLKHSKQSEGMPIKPSYNITVFPVCGGNFTDPNGQIDSTTDLDGYGSKQCRWSIRVRESRTIRIKVEYYSIDSSWLENSCQDRDSLEIRNGQYADSPLLTRPLCGHNATAFTLAETSSNVATIIYRSTRKDNAFKLSYKEVGLGCGGTLVLHRLADQVTISSPGYPNSPGHDVSCEWIIRGPIDYGLKIFFKDEHNEGYGCDKEKSYINVYDGGSDLSGLVASNCVPVSSGVATVSVTNHVTLIRYVLNKADFNSRFEATVKVESCNEELFVGWSDSEEYQFPRADLTTGRRIASLPDTCTLRLRARNDFQIVLDIKWMVLHGTGCNAGESIRISEPNTEPRPENIFCAPRNTTEGETVQVTLKEMVITYKRMGYSPDSATGLGGIKFIFKRKYHEWAYMLQAESFPKRLNSPNFPKAVKGELWYMWTLTSEPGTRIRVRFDWFDLGLDYIPNANGSLAKKCKTKLMLARAMANRPEYTFGCSAERPRVIESIANLMVFALNSDVGLEERQGFKLTYQTIEDDSNDTCSSPLDETHGQLISGHFYDSNFTKEVNCLWEIKVEKQNQSGTILLDTFDVPDNCTWRVMPLMIGYIEKYPRFRQSICLKPPIRPEVTRRKHIVPIIHSTYYSVNPSILFLLNRTTQSRFYRGIRGEYFINNCGGTIAEGFEGELHSPNYPQSYSSDTFCHWSFPYDSRMLRISFTEFDIGENCEEDYFEIRTLSESVGKHKVCYSGQLPPPITLEYNSILSFVSSANLSLDSPTSSKPGPFGRPRKWTFKVERVTHGCGGTILAKRGDLHSPKSNPESSSSQYPANSECVWHLRAHDDFHLVFKFKDRFDLEQSNNCTADFLLFEERRLEPSSGQLEWRPLARFCGHQAPDDLKSNSSEVRVTFRSNDKTSGDGFHVEYQQACGGLMQHDSGVVYSPNYMTRGTDRMQLRCVYQIQRAAHEYIQIEFDDVDLDMGGGECHSSSLVVYLGDSDNQTTPTYGPYCTMILPPSLVSRERMDLVLTTNSYNSHRGFKLRYWVTSCGGNFTEPNGVVESPELVNTERKRCVWNITVPDTKASVALKFIQLDMAPDLCRYECCNSLRITNSVTNWGFDNTLAYLCGNNDQEVVIKSRKNQVFVFFDQYNPGKNAKLSKSAKFKLAYWSTPGPEQGCGGSIEHATEGAVVSPDIDGDSNYEPNLHCVWSIVPQNPLTQIISLEFERFDVEGNDSGLCDKDFLEIYDGASAHSQLLTKLCGRNTLPDKIVSSTGTLLLQFVSDSEGTGHGFRVHYKVENRSCGGALITSDDRQELISPGYPTGYPEPLHCTWDLRRKSRYSRTPTILHLTDLDLNCTRGDVLQVIEYSTYSSSTHLYRPIKLCSSPSPVKVMLRNQVRLDLRTGTGANQAGVTYDNANQTSVAPMSKAVYRGFRLTHHTTLCNDTIEGPDNGILFNRRFPETDSVYRTLWCYINITVPADRQISLYFSQLQLYQCHYSNLTIYVGNSSLAYTTLCDMTTPPNPIFTKSNSVSLVLRAQYLPQPKGVPYDPHSVKNKLLYSITYSSSLASEGLPGCGGNLTSLSGTFTSPNYPNPLMESRMCRWLIHGSGSHTISLQFDFFLLSHNCETNFVVIYDGEDDVEEKKLATFCGTDKPATIQSQSSALTLKLYTSMENFEPGFRASYKINTQEPTIRGRVITSDTFKFYHDYKVFTDV